jgi:hypothetical protein
MTTRKVTTDPVQEFVDAWHDDGDWREKAARLTPAQARKAADRLGYTGGHEIHRAAREGILSLAQGKSD